MTNLNCFIEESITRKPTGSGSLDGFGFAVKDLVSIKGHISSFGHPRWRETHCAAVRDSSVLTRLLNEGAEFVGITKMDQLAYSIVGNIGEGEAPINTKYPEKFCGGSSSGSASAVAGGLVDFAVGSDTGGSIRIPAAVCGIYGIRTTYGLIPKDGVIPLAKSSDVLGFFARTPEILKRVMAIFMSDLKNEPVAIKRLLLPSSFSDYTDIDAAKFKDAASQIAHANRLVIKEVDIRYLVSPEVKDMMGRNHSREIWKAHGEWIEKNKTHLASEVQAGLEKCKELARDDESVIRKDRRAFIRYSNELREFIGKDAILCLPVLPIGGPNREWTNRTIQDYKGRTFMLVPPSSVSGLPEVSAPIHGATTNIGVIGPPYSDLQLIDLLCHKA